MEFPASGRQIVKISAAPTLSLRTGELVSLDKVDKNTSYTAWMNEANLTSTRSGSAYSIY
jgi:hypothetical protein